MVKKSNNSDFDVNLDKQMGESAMKPTAVDYKTRQSLQEIADKTFGAGELNISKTGLAVPNAGTKETAAFFNSNFNPTTRPPQNIVG
jgi:hypothetical protein